MLAVVFYSICHAQWAYYPPAGLDQRALQQAWDYGYQYMQKQMAKMHDPKDCPGEVECETCNGSGVSYNRFTGRGKCFVCNGQGHHLCGNAGCAGYRMGKQLAESGALNVPSGGSYVAPSGSSGYSGSSSHTSPRPCSGCGGSGRCTACSGLGYYYQYVTDYTGYGGGQQRFDCGSCGGRGTCRVCYGKGRL